MTLNAFSHQASGNITWLASYPKSGNTWMRAFLSHVLMPEDAVFDLNRLYVQGIASSREVFELYTGLDSCDLTVDEINKIRPDLYRHISDAVPERHYCKVHDAYRLINGHTIFPNNASKRVLYIIRNPLDVAVSYKHHLQKDNIEAVTALCNPKGGLALATNRLPNQLPQHMGTWSQHVSSWVQQKNMPVIVVRYEDMVLDTFSTFAKVLTELELNISSKRVQAAIDETDFQRLQQLEQTLGFHEKPQLMPRFFRKGKIGSWRDELNQSDMDEIIRFNKVVMQQFAYLDANDKPVF